MKKTLIILKYFAFGMLMVPIIAMIVITCNHITNQDCGLIGTVMSISLAVIFGIKIHEEFNNLKP